MTKTDFAEVIRLYREWNERINVISRKDIDNIYEHHILHSLAIAEFHPFLPGTTVLDVGTGGGFPGIPLAMRFPETRFTLCDSIGKKVKVASAVADSLGLANVECVNARVETLHGVYDYVVSRAVAALDKFYPMVRGRFGKSVICLKGGDVESEIGNLVRHCGVRRDRISVSPINSVFKDEYFAEKFVIEIEK
ncbi:MAG: 16S rRNA (guanine(527)-N(7))-methyltransferase RsmG [Bacteroidales bacterium]|nr:16S rRNA (guanine(527)-N(7))-methyltransferase RsmG [Bacteroidales bacterium]